MNKITSDGWLYRGSSVIFNHAVLNSLVSSQVSLRKALSWHNNLPDNPPFHTKTILVTGLEAVLETIDVTDADDFLVKRIQPLLRYIQRNWTDIGIVLGFANPPGAFELTAQEEYVLFRRREGKKVNLSNGLWDGSAPQNMLQIMSEPQGSSGGDLIGYHVSRIS
jgi:hypothetical protein